MSRGDFVSEAEGVVEVPLVVVVLCEPSLVGVTLEECVDGKLCHVVGLPMDCLRDAVGVLGPGVACSFFGSDILGG